MEFQKTVCIVDDHILLSQAIAELINTFDDYKVIGTYNNGSAYIKELEKLDFVPDITLMDINMPILNGIETTHFLTKKYPEIKVIALSVEADETSILKMLRAGSKGYLLKDIAKEELLHALDEISLNGFYHDRNVSDILVNSLNKSPSKIAIKEKELDFLKLACSEMTYKEIADKMKLSPKTIDGYRNSLFEKLEVKNRVGLVLYAIKHDIYTVE